MLLEGGLECEILQASSGNEAITILELEENIDFLISEVDMSGGNGLDLVSHLEKRNINCPIIWLSDPKNKESLAVENSKALTSMVFFSSKPFKDNEFFPVLDQLLSQLVKKETKDLEDKETQKSKDNKDDWDISIAKKKGNEVEADWSLGGSKKHNDEVEASWSLEADKKKKSEEEASWSLKQNLSKNEEIEADWNLSIENEAGQQEEADWEIKKVSSQEELEADWSLKKEEKDKNSPQSFDEFSSKWSLTSEQTKRGGSSFYPIEIKRLLSLKKTPCDIFLQLGHDKNVKLFNCNELVDEDAVTKYIEKNVKSILVKKSDYKTIIEELSLQIFSKLEQASNIGGEVKLVAEMAAYKSVIEKAREFGITETTAKSVERAIESSLKSFSSKLKISQILQKIMRGQDYLTEHSLMLSYVSGQICLGTSWSSTQSLQKLSMASLLHDSFLNSHLASLHDLNPQKIDSLPKELQEEVRQHIIKAAGIIAEGIHVFPDVEDIIMHHHEKPDQSGYPKNIDPVNLSPMSCLFIISHDYVDHIYSKSADMPSLNKIKQNFIEKYSKGNFKKSLEGFLNMF